jgi:hypothetical protein
MRWNCFHVVIFLPYLLTPLSAQVSKPLTTQYLECARDALGNVVGSRTERTAVFAAKDKARAYGVVAAKYGYGACTNISSVYIAAPQRPFTLVFKQVAEPLPDGTVYDGNGIQAIRWSPSGKRLLIEVSQPEEVILKRFTNPCQMSVTSRGWSDDSHIEFEVGPSKTYDVEGVPDPEPPCVEHTTKFTFDVVSQTLRP